MKKWLGIAILFVGCVCFGWWFWSLGNLPADEVQKMTIEPTGGKVEIQRNTKSDWEEVKSQTDLGIGDKIKTDETGTATIHEFGKGESRLGNGSEVTIQKASGGETVVSPITVQLNLSAGRMWTRLLRLLDVHSAFEVQVNQVIATVRGTAFDVLVSSTSTSIFVSDSGVQVHAEKDLVVNEGSMASFSERNTVVESRPLSDEEKYAPWFKDNSKLDATFLDQSQKDLRVRLASLGGRRPDSILEGLVRLSERAHLGVAGDRASTEYAQYVNRRLFQIEQMIEGGDSGFAFQALSQLEEDVDAKLKSSDADRYRAELQRRLTEITRLLEDVNPSAPTYRLKQRVEDLETSISDETGNPILFLYTRLVTIESSFLSADTILNQGSSLMVKELLDAGHDGLANVDHDITKLPASTDASDKQTLQGKLLALQAREAGLRDRLSALLSPYASTSTAAIPGDQATTSTSQVSTSTVMIPTSTVSIPVPTSTQSPVPSTPKPVVAPPKPAHIPVRIDLVPQGQTTISSGGRLPFQALVTYADGTTKDVSQDAAYTVSNAQLGSVQGSTFFANNNQSFGDVRVTARYTEDGSIVSGILDITIK